MAASKLTTDLQSSFYVNFSKAYVGIRVMGLEFFFPKYDKHLVTCQTCRHKTTIQQRDFSIKIYTEYIFNN